MHWKRIEKILRKNLMQFDRIVSFKYICIIEIQIKKKTELQFQIEKECKSPNRIWKKHMWPEKESNSLNHDVKLRSKTLRVYPITEINRVAAYHRGMHYSSQTFYQLYWKMKWNVFLNCINTLVILKRGLCSSLFCLVQNWRLQSFLRIFWI